MRFRHAYYQQPLEYHSVYVQQVGSARRFFAVCMTCGADPFPDRETRAEAEADAEAHGQLVALSRGFDQT